MTTPRIRAVIVEDELHARATLRDHAAAIDWLAIIGEAGDGLEATRVIDALEPDLVFLDITLPELSGIAVLERIRHTPEVVFTTAHDEYALTAFELGALDYLLKPFGAERFRTALERVQRRLALPVPGTGHAPERARTAFGVPLRRLFARERDAIVPIDVHAIQHLSACDDYVEVHSDRGCHLVHTTLADLVARLDPAVFRQIHRSHVVNLDAVVKIVPFDARRLCVHLRDGTQIVASRSASEQLRASAG